MKASYNKVGHKSKFLSVVTKVIRNNFESKLQLEAALNDIKISCNKSNKKQFWKQVTTGCNKRL